MQLYIIYDVNYFHRLVEDKVQLLHEDYIL